MADNVWTALAIALAVIDSICFAAAAVYQQRAVRRTVTGDQRVGAGPQPRQHLLSLRGLLSLPTQPGWLGGVGLMIFGGTLHSVALVLAPVSVIQPIGILGVPIAVLLAAKLARQRPPRAILIPILLCVVSVGAFVAVTAGQVSADGRLPIGTLLIIEAALMAVIGIAYLISRRIHGWSRCLVSAVAGALGVGMVAALVRAIAQHTGAGLHGIDVARLFEPVTLLMIALLILNAVVGGVMVQQAYASGPAEVVLATLTVVDPMIAVLFGLIALHEGGNLHPVAIFGMIICGLAAVAGVITLARTHPEVAARRAPAVEKAPVRELALVGSAGMVGSPGLVGSASHPEFTDDLDNSYDASDFAGGSYPIDAGPRLGATAVKGQR